MALDQDARMIGTIFEQLQGKSEFKPLLTHEPPTVQPLITRFNMGSHG